MSTPPLVQLPISPLWMNKIDVALYEIMEAKYVDRRMGASTKCAEFAILGARVLRLMSNRPYIAVAGSQIVDFGNQQFTLISPTRSERRNARKLADIRQYHCWIQCEHLATEKTCRLELIDFTDRYNEQIAVLLNHQPSDLPSKNYFWEWADEANYPIPESLISHPSISTQKFGWRWEDKAISRLLNEYESENEGYFSYTTSQILHRVADNAEALMRESLVNNSLIKDP